MKQNSKQKKSNLKSKSRFKDINYKVLFFDLLALICLYLTFKIDWIFILPAIVLVYFGQKELFK
ncbi:MAG: hypothetical protein WC867_05360 [Candidatus Pacearchaeota archaeon]|jgi:hypothetical protein